MFGKLVFGPFFLLFSSSKSLFKSVSVPAVIYFLVNMEMQGVLDFFWASGWLIGGVAYIVLECVLLLLMTLLGVNATRVVLLGGSLSAVGVRWTKRESAYFLYTLLFMLPLYLMTLPEIFLNKAPLEVRFAYSLLYLVLMIGWVWVFSRLLLVFPSIAVDGRMSLKDSWRLTRKYQWVFLLSILCVGGMFVVMGGMLQLIPFGHIAVHAFHTLLALVVSLMLAAYYAEVVVKEIRPEHDRFATEE